MTTMRTTSILAAGLVAFGVFLAPARARASASFPPAIQSHLGAPTPIPACTVCHDTASGGSGTANKAFASTMKKNGLVAGDVASVNKALDAVATAKTDSDSDGTDDIDELKAGRDPSSPDCPDGGTQCASVSKIIYGCSSAGSDASASTGAALLALATVASMRRTRRRR